VQPEEKKEHALSQVRHCLTVFFGVASRHNGHTSWQKVQTLCICILSSIPQVRHQTAFPAFEIPLLIIGACSLSFQA